VRCRPRPRGSIVPTIAESGVPGFDVVSWYGFFVPAKTPTEIITKMNVDMRRSPIRAFMDAWRRSVTRAGPTLPRVSAHFSGRKSKSGVASSSKPASVRRNERAGWISIARMPQPHEGHSKTRLPSLSAHSSRPAAPGLILHCQRPGDCQLKSCSALPHRSRGVGITNNG
jgi:hypothetical protein